MYDFKYSINNLKTSAGLLESWLAHIVVSQRHCHYRLDFLRLFSIAEFRIDAVHVLFIL